MATVDLGTYESALLERAAINRTSRSPSVHSATNSKPQEKAPSDLLTDSEGIREQQEPPAANGAVLLQEAQNSEDKRKRKRPGDMAAVHLSPFDNVSTFGLPLPSGGLHEGNVLTTQDLGHQSIYAADIIMNQIPTDSVAPDSLHSNVHHDFPQVLMPTQVPDECTRKGYAKLSFPDSDHIIRTLSVLLKRDQRAYQEALRKAEAASESESQSRPSSADNPAHLAMRGIADSGRSCDSRSEKAGIVPLQYSSDEGAERQRRRERKSRISGKYSSKSKVKASVVDAASRLLSGSHDILEAYPPATGCFELPMHLAANEPPQAYKSISRNHAKIEYEAYSQCWHITPIAKNGLFVNDTFVPAGESALLEHGAQIQIGPISIVFTLPEEARNIAQLSSEDEASVASYDSQSVSRQSSSPNSSLDEVDSEIHPDDEIETIEPDEQVDATRGLEQRPRTKLKIKAMPDRQNLKTPPPSRRKDSKAGLGPKESKKKGKKGNPVEGRQEKKSDKAGLPDSQKANEAKGTTEDALPAEVPVKRKGPGRPPKDGIMSKRERQARAKQAKEAEKAKKLGLPPPVLDLKTKTEKKKEKKKEEEEAANSQHTTTVNGDVKSSGNATPVVASSSNQVPAGDEQKTSKPAKPPRSPSPQIKESDFTEEQLARPPLNYVTLIHEAITNSKNNQMNLQQIYSAIERKYPWFKFRVPTTGWQSSVRHNLGQNDMFVKVDKDGKGWMWTIKEGATPENQKRKRSSPTPMQHQTLYPPNHFVSPTTATGQQQPSSVTPYQGYAPRQPFNTGSMHPPAPPVVAPPAQTSSNYSSPYAVNPAPQAAPINSSQPTQYPQQTRTTTPHIQSHNPNISFPAQGIRIPNRPSSNGASIPNAPTQAHPPQAKEPPATLHRLLDNDYPENVPPTLPAGVPELTTEMIARFQKFKDVFVAVSKNDQEFNNWLIKKCVRTLLWPHMEWGPITGGEAQIVNTLRNLMAPGTKEVTKATAGGEGEHAAEPATVDGTVAEAKDAAVVAQQTNTPVENANGEPKQEAVSANAEVAAEQQQPSHAAPATPAATTSRPPTRSGPSTPQAPSVEPLTPVAHTPTNGGNRVRHGSTPQKRERDGDAEESAAEREARGRDKRARTEEGN
ncbi:MAG: hypothetical protein M1820_008874 [Bogoriella megaspora]|nr:MAG: hypothetical protein M1820_008874 [Bogoriella megaspora]